MIVIFNTTLQDFKLCPNFSHKLVQEDNQDSFAINVLYNAPSCAYCLTELSFFPCSQCLKRHILATILSKLEIVEW